MVAIDNVHRYLDRAIRVRCGRSTPSSDCIWRAGLYVGVLELRPSAVRRGAPDGVSATESMSRSSRWTAPMVREISGKEGVVCDE